MRGAAAWLLIMGGAVALLVGVAVGVLTFRFGFRWSREDQAMLRDNPPTARFRREAFDDLWRSDPSLAAQAMAPLRRMEELAAAGQDPYQDVRRFVRILKIARWVAAGLVVLGGAAVVGGIAWL